MFFGDASFVKHEVDYFSHGIDYLRRATEHILVGCWVESVFAEKTEWTIGIPLYCSLYHFWLRIGPGIEIISEEIDNEIRHEVKGKSKTEFLFRSGIGYTFYLVHFLISPSLTVIMSVPTVRSYMALIWDTVFEMRYMFA